MLIHEESAKVERGVGGCGACDRLSQKVRLGQTKVDPIWVSEVVIWVDLVQESQIPFIHIHIFQMWLLWNFVCFSLAEKVKKICIWPLPYIASYGCFLTKLWFVKLNKIFNWLGLADRMFLIGWTDKLRTCELGCEPTFRAVALVLRYKEREEWPLPFHSNIFQTGQVILLMKGDAKEW